MPCAYCRDYGDCVNCPCVTAARERCSEEDIENSESGAITIPVSPSLAVKGEKE